MSYSCYVPKARKAQTFRSVYDRFGWIVDKNGRTIPTKVGDFDIDAYTQSFKNQVGIYNQIKFVGNEAYITVPETLPENLGDISGLPTNVFDAEKVMKEGKQANADLSKVFGVDDFSRMTVGQLNELLKQRQEASKVPGSDENKKEGE